MKANSLLARIQSFGILLLMLGAMPMLLFAMPVPVPTASPQIPVAGEPSGAIDVSTLPAGVTLWFDGIYLGVTPLFLDALPPGHHTITLTKSGWATQEFGVELSPGAVIMTSRRLHELVGSKNSTRGSGSIMIHGMVEPGSLRIDGVAPHPSPSAALRLPSGIHSVNASVAGRSLTRAFTVFPDTMGMLVLDARTPDSVATLVVPVESSLPPNSLSLVGEKIVIRVNGHLAVGHLHDSILRLDGVPVELNPPPVLVGRRLYLPLSIIDRLRQGPSARQPPRDKAP